MKIEKLNESLNEDVKVCYETDLTDFEFWSGAQRTASVLTDKELSQISDMLDEMYPEGMTETQINDTFWFEDDWIAEMLGYSDFETLYDERQNNVDEAMSKDQLLEMPVYSLDTQYDSRKSFYNKAKVDTGDKGDKNKLYSYDTLVAEVIDGKPVVYGTYSQTTLRHIKEWLKQLGYKADSAKQIMNDYGDSNNQVNEDVLTENIKEQDRIQALAEYLNIDAVDISSFDEYYFDTPEGEYIVATSKEAHKLAVKDIENLFDDIGVDSFTPNFRQWIYDNAVDSHWFKDALYECEEAYVNDIESEEGRLEEELVDAGIVTPEDFESEDFDIDDAKQRYIDYLVEQAGDPIEFYKDNFGQNEFNQIVRTHNLIDIGRVAEEAIEWDGISHFIATYDGEEIELGNGLFAYRTN